MSLTAIDNAGVEFIAGFEGFVGHVYSDAVGVRTIGFGETNPALLRKYARGITRAQALALLRERVNRDYLPAVRALPNSGRLSNAQVDALASLAYNCGTGALAGGIRSAMRVGRLDLVPATILQYDKAGGHVLAGLTRRRRAEVALWVSHSHAAAAPTLSHLTAHERAACLELDKLRRAGVHSKRRDELVAYATRQRKRIWHQAHEAHGGGWKANHRLERYHALSARTR